MCQTDFTRNIQYAFHKYVVIRTLLFEISSLINVFSESGNEFSSRSDEAE